jgi:aminopeptidase N
MKIFKSMNLYQNIFLFMGIIFSIHSAVASTSQNPKVDKYKVKVEPDFVNKSIVGSTEIVFIEVLTDAIEFPLSGLSIDSVSSDGKAIPYFVDQAHLKIPALKSKNRSVTSVEIKYHGQPSKGLVWGQTYLYTNYDPCTWMICFDEPGIRAKFEIELKIPDTMKTVATGYLSSSKIASDKKRSEIWTETRGYSSYLYGFAIGLFERASQKYGSVELEFLGSSDTAVDLQKKFKETEQIIKFFEEKSGVAIPTTRYTQVLIADDEAQEKQTFSILGKSFVDPILTDPKEDWAIVHELAHQWWGNLLTCKSWDHFWLNEGIVVFMTAAYKQTRWGQVAYDREIELAKKRYQKAIDSKFDVPLTFGGEYPSLGIKRSIVYSKGALFMDALRKEIGDSSFWLGLKEYTIKNQLKSVESKDFQNAMEKSSGKDLAKIFKLWVY